MQNYSPLYHKLNVKYMNLSIKNKILIFFIAIIIFISTILGLYSYMISSKSLKDEVTSINVKDIKQISSSINFLQQDVIDLSTFICLNPLVQSFTNSKDSSIEYQNFTKYGLEPLNILLASKDYISFMSIYGNEGSKYYLSKDGSNGAYSYEKIKESAIYSKIKELKGSPLWINLDDENNVFIADNKNPKIAMVRSIIDTNTLEESGLMLICINTSFIQNLYSTDFNTKNSGIFLLDNYNKIITQSDAENILHNGENIQSILPYIHDKKSYNTIWINGEKYLTTFSKVSKSDWTIVSMTRESTLFHNLRSIMFITLAVIISCFVMSFLISIFLSSKVTQPINQLLSSMKKAKEGNFREKVNFKYTDELGMLVYEYNDMIDNIKTLIDKVYTLQLKEKEAELKALQAQINPHFLYNTLDMIFWKAEKSNQQEISDMIYALSHLFRITLSKGNEFIPVKSEKDFIEHYLLLQSKRYRDKLIYDIDISDEISNYLIPKLIIQPFVENSIIHGTEADNDLSIIKITGCLSNSYLDFTIEDNGKGIDEDTMNSLLHSSINQERKNTNFQKGYAIGNVNQRLSLYYSDDYKLNIISRINEGTKVELSIPISPHKIDTK
ncbi:sensor histidine kinase [Clostridium intestinale]|uniref:sensor histidine kinase n=1 Tax=Clostridium intestinale TaxID=36845 RepID=UPI002DD68C06|nr:sensor histidine kinase [Clostridium intestinale]WRY50046.1 sensor histidine kinase [Clostridium intestinale]